MPKKIFTKVILPTVQPDSCDQCPLLGLIPKEERPKGSKETHVCLGTQEALAGRGTKSASIRHKRPCDQLWDSWMLLPFRKFGIPCEYYVRYRVPYIQTRQMTIKFH